MPNITNLATSTPGTVVENKIPSVSNLVYNPKIGVIENKFTTGHGHSAFHSSVETLQSRNGESYYLLGYSVYLPIRRSFRSFQDALVLKLIVSLELDFGSFLICHFNLIS